MNGERPADAWGERGGACRLPILRRLLQALQGKAARTKAREFAQTPMTESPRRSQRRMAELADCPRQAFFQRYQAYPPETTRRITALQALTRSGVACPNTAPTRLVKGPASRAKGLAPLITI